MSEVIDVGSEWLVDGSTIRNPYVRLLTAVLGQKLAQGSPWVAVSKWEPSTRRASARVPLAGTALPPAAGRKARAHATPIPIAGLRRQGRANHP